MKTNVINNGFSVQCFEGSLTIIGQRPGALVFLLDGHSVGDLVWHQPPFCKNAIVTFAVGSQRRMLFFEYSLKEELRNPQKLLKSVRNKLVQAGFHNRRENERQSRVYEMTDRQEHEMYQ